MYIAIVSIRLVQPCTHMLVSHNQHPHDITVLGDESPNSTSAATLATLYYPDRVRNGAIVIPTSSVHRSPEVETSSQEETSSTLRKISTVWIEKKKKKKRSQSVRKVSV
jgi:hypothetical protein